MKFLIKWTLTLVFLALFMGLCVGLGSAVECSSQLDWLKNASLINLNSTKIIKYPDIFYGSFYSGTLENWKTSFTATIYNNISIASNCVVNNYCLNFTYNFTAVPASTYLIIYGNDTSHDTSNYSGIGFWYKGDGSSHSLQGNAINTATFGSYEHKITSSKDVEKSCNLSSTEWRYCYIDFSFIKNASNNVPLNMVYLNNTRRFSLILWNSTGKQEGNIYITNVSFVDFDSGSANYLRWANKTNTNRNSRYQEGLYNLIYLYNFGGVGWLNNGTYLNYTLDQMDWLVRHQLYDGGWADDVYQSHTTAAGNGFTGIAFMKSLVLLNGNERLNDNITIFIVNTSVGLDGNIVTLSRGNLYNRTALNMANYNRPYGLSAFTSNQYFGMYHARWLYYNYTGLSTYLDSINGNLTLADNDWQLNRFGFNWEENSSSNMGFDIGYQGVSVAVLSSFYQDSRLPILNSIISKLDVYLLNIINSGYGFLPNGSRSTNFTNGVFDSFVSKTAIDLNLPYLNQSVYLSLVYNKSSTVNSLGLGSSLGGSNLSGNTPFRSTVWAVENYKYCTTPITNSGFRFPQNYTFYSYNMFNQTSFIRNVNNQSGDILRRDGLEFPQIYYAYDFGCMDYWSLNKSQGFTYIYNYDLIEELNQTVCVTNALIFNLTSICNGSSSNVALNTGNINVTLNPGEACYVLDNFNLTEGVIIENSPLVLTFSTNTSKLVTSSLDEGINSTFIFNITSCDSRPGVITSTYQTWYPGQYSCSGDTIIITDVIFGIGETYFTIEYGYDDFIEPLDLKSILVDTLSGSSKIFFFLMLITIASLAGYFRLPNTVALVFLGLFMVFMFSINPGFYLLAILFFSVTISYSIGRLIKN